MDLRVFDTVSSTLGDQSGLTYCGNRVYTLEDVYPDTANYNEFMSIDFDSGLLVAQSDEEEHVGTYDFTFKVGLEDYPSISQLTNSLTISIKFCKLTDLIW